MVRRNNFMKKQTAGAKKMKVAAIFGKGGLAAVIRKGPKKQKIKTRMTAKDKRQQAERMLPPMRGRLIIYDTETTGFTEKDGIVEIGAVELIDGKMTGNNFHAYANTTCVMSAGALNVHGLTPAFLSKHPPVSVAMSQFIEYIGSSPMLAHNAKFDVRMCNQELKKLDMSLIPIEQVFCTLKWHRKVYPSSGHKLDNICAALGVDNSHRTLHGALLDAEITAEVVLKFWEMHPELIAGGGVVTRSVGGGLERSTTTRTSKFGSSFGGGGSGFGAAKTSFGASRNSGVKKRTVFGSANKPSFGPPKANGCGAPRSGQKVVEKKAEDDFDFSKFRSQKSKPSLRGIFGRN